MSTLLGENAPSVNKILVPLKLQKLSLTRYVCLATLVVASQGVTALMYATASDHLEVVELLVSKGAEVDKRHSNGGTALMECAASASEGNLKVVEFLIKKGSDHAFVDFDGVTPLMSAASQGQC